MLQRLIPPCLLSKGKKIIENSNTWNYDNDFIRTKVMPEVLSPKKSKQKKTNMTEDSMPAVATCIFLLFSDLPLKRETSFCCLIVNGCFMNLGLFSKKNSCVFCYSLSLKATEKQGKKYLSCYGLILFSGC